MKKPWMFRPAKWYQFWLPQSGFIGGAMFAATGLTLITLAHFLWKCHY